MTFTIPNEHIPTDEDMQRYENNDDEIVPILIEGLMSYIFNTINWYLKQNQHLLIYKEDCVAEGFYALTRVVNQQLGKTFQPMEFMSYIQTSCLNQVKDWLANSATTITIPRNTKVRNSLTVTQVKLKEQIQDDNVFNSIGYSKFINDLDSFDLQLLQLKFDGLSNRQIGKEMGLHWQHVKNHLVRIVSILES